MKMPARGMVRPALVAVSNFKAMNACAQPLQCEIDGAWINPANGHTTAAKTGLMRCRDSAGRLQREEEIKDGQFIGIRTFYDSDGGKRTGNVNERGNRDGLQREYWPDGTLKREETAANGENIGITRTFYPSGKPERIARAPERDIDGAISLEFNEVGQLMRVACSAANSLKEAEAPCGHAGRAENDLHSALGEVIGREAWVDGRLIKRTALKSGAPTSQMEIIEAMRIEKTFHPDGGGLRSERSVALDADGRARRLRDGRDREFAPSGQQLREVQWRDGIAIRETDWFMNGSRRAEIERPNAAERSAMTSPATATQRLYRESRSLKTETRFHPQGWRERQTEFDDTGKPASTEEFFEDGSRKMRPP